MAILDVKHVSANAQRPSGAGLAKTRGFKSRLRLLVFPVVVVVVMGGSFAREGGRPSRMPVVDVEAEVDVGGRLDGGIEMVASSLSWRVFMRMPRLVLLVLEVVLDWSGGVVVLMGLSRLALPRDMLGLAQSGSREVMDGLVGRLIGSVAYCTLLTH